MEESAGIFKRFARNPLARGLGRVINSQRQKAGIRQGSGATLVHLADSPLDFAEDTSAGDAESAIGRRRPQRDRHHRDHRHPLRVPAR